MAIGTDCGRIPFRDKLTFVHDQDSICGSKNRFSIMFGEQDGTPALAHQG